MFRWLNRLYRALWILIGILILALLWNQRYRVLPAKDYYTLWHQVDYNFPSALSTQPVELVRVVSETIFHVRDKEGTLWALALSGCEGVSGLELQRSKDLRDWTAEVRSEMTELLEAGTIEVAFQSKNMNRTANGFLYLDGELFLVRMVAEGWVRMRGESTKTLPLREQYALLLADREARAEVRGVWDPDLNPAHP